MGFFKNLIKGKFKKIGKNFTNNLADGKLFKGTGFKALDRLGEKGFSIANAKLGGQLGNIGRLAGGRDMETRKAQGFGGFKSSAKNYQKEIAITPLNSSKSAAVAAATVDDDGKSNIVLYALIGLGAFFLIKNKKS